MAPQTGVQNEEGCSEPQEDYSVKLSLEAQGCTCGHPEPKQQQAPKMLLSKKRNPGKPAKSRLHPGCGRWVGMGCKASGWECFVLTRMHAGMSVVQKRRWFLGIH
eukprot:450879-Pelagomonas_calceolata.AAC.1